MIMILHFYGNSHKHLMWLYGKYKLLGSEIRLLLFTKARTDSSDRTTAENQIVILCTVACFCSVSCRRVVWQ